MAFCAEAPSADATLTRPSSSTSIFTPVRSMMLRIILPPGPIERFPHDVGGDAAHLDVHLQCRDAVGRAGHLEVHVAVVIFRPGDVREDGVLAGLLIHPEAHR